MRLFQSVALALLLLYPATAGSQSRQFVEEQRTLLGDRLGELSESAAALLLVALEQSMDERLAVFEKHGVEDVGALGFRQKLRFGRDMRKVQREAEEKSSALLSPERVRELQRWQADMREALEERRQ